MKTITQLFADYFVRTPSYSRVVQKYIQPQKVHIDHIAFRSLQPAPIYRMFRQLGFTMQKDVYLFPQLMTRAVWMKAPLPKEYRVFISESMRKHEPPLMWSPRDFREVAKTDQYLAWVLVHGHAINHVAIGVENIENMYQDLQKDPKFEIGAPLRISQDGKLKQFSLKADLVKHQFRNGEIVYVPGSFIELIERSPGREGFDTDNAQTIFSSTSPLR